MKETKKCPFCGGEILATAKKCKHCKQFIEKKENKADDITKDIDTLSNTPTKNQIIGAIIVVAIIVLIIVGFVSCTSNNLFTGCIPPNSNTPDYMRWHCKDNEYYDTVDVYIENKQPNFNGYKDSYTLGQQIYKDGEYVCTSYTQPDEIHHCNGAQFTKLMKESSLKLDSILSLNRTKREMLYTISSIIDTRKSFVSQMSRKIYDEKLYNWDYHISQDKPKYEHRFPLNCKEMISALDIDEKITDLKIDSCQIKFKNDDIVAFSEDGKKATVYNSSDDPKYYVTFKIQDFSNPLDNTYKITYDYIDEQIPANDYIQNAINLRHFTDEEMKAEKIY